MLSRLRQAALSGGGGGGGDRPRAPTVAWRTNQPGGCAPSFVFDPGARGAEPPFGDRFWAAYEHAPRYNHARFLERDAQAAAAFAARGWPVVDMRMLYWRADAHVDARRVPADRKRDCLHFCLRSAALPSTFPRMLLHALTDGMPRPPARPPARPGE